MGLAVKDKDILCALNEITDPGSCGFSAQLTGGTREILVVRVQDRVYGYINSCPHTGAPLDWIPDRFLSLEGDYIQCANHDALFRIEDGICVSGPCTGQGLGVVPLEVVDGMIILSRKADGCLPHTGHENHEP